MGNMNRLLKRNVKKYFGRTRYFILWCALVIITIYIIDSYILTNDHLETVLGTKKNVQVPGESVALRSPNAPESEKEHENIPIKSSPKKSVKSEEEHVVLDEANKVEKPVVDENIDVTQENCGIKCPKGQFSYYMQSGEGRDTSPTICFAGNIVMSTDIGNGHRGLNVATVNVETHEVTDIRYFDLYLEEEALVRYLKLGVEENHAILVASMDEASTALKNTGREWLYKYGAGKGLQKLGYREAYLMVGQRGLAKGTAVEKVGPKEGSFAPVIKMHGCISFPLGDITPLKVEKPKVEEVSSLKLGEELPNCGVKEGCGSESFAAHLYTGKGSSNGPKICVNGKYVMATGLNDGGRGLNIVIVDPKSKEVVRVGHFDTYAQDSSNLEIFLEMMNDKEIILAVAHDDASKNLNLHAQKLLVSLGSSMIEKLTFRDVWSFVGQRGIGGMTSFEEIEFALPNNGYALPIDKKFCVPFNLKGSKIKPDPLAHKNERRRKFCSKYDGYGDFCEAEHIDEALTPAPLSDKSMENHAIFKVPIIVVPGLNHIAVRMQLETILMQQGIKNEMVTVMYDENFPEPSALAELFKFKTEKLSSSTKYIFQVEKALDRVWDLYPNAEYVIFFEEEIILAPDFLSFMAQCLDVLEADESLGGASAFNMNGYEGLSTSPDLAYRTEDFPGLGFMLKRSVYVNYMKSMMQECCLSRAWEDWKIAKSPNFEMIVPDVSRVYRRPYEGLAENAEFLMELFNRPRVTNLNQIKIQNIKSLPRKAYDEELNHMIQAAVALDTSNVLDCLQGKGLGFYIPESTGKTYLVFFEQETKDDDRILSRLCKCFNLFSANGYKSRGLYHGLLRFTYLKHNMLFIGSLSPYAKYKPETYKQVNLNQL